jgi:7-carboxy-7-deazaguanine synthase
MLISEIFHSIQGEGSLTGTPSVFIRTSGCNLRCRWCDTPYASWNPEGTEMEIPEILAAVEKFPSRHCVLTGGEPMVARGIRELAAELRQLGRHITIETAGTISSEGIACDLASVSPKLANSTPDAETAGAAWTARHEKTRIQPEVLRAWTSMPDYQFKFVWSSPADTAEIETLIASIGIKIPPEKILLMPEGTDPAALRSREAELVDLCLQRGFRFCDRLHIRLFGNTRGT